jgi:uncharacterized protein
MSASLLVALATMAGCQLFKLVLYSIRDRRLRLAQLVSTGGMPSAHSALVTALSVSLALWRGVDSEVFAVSAVFASIVVYDSVRLRGMVDLHTRILRDLQARVPGSRGIAIPRWVGHTAAETVAGVVVGAAAAVLAGLLLRRPFPEGSIAW